MRPPVIVDPFATFGDEIAGETPDEVALNLKASTKVSRGFRCKLLRQAPNLRTAFRGCELSDGAKDACRWVKMMYDHLQSPRRQPREAA